VAGIDLGQELVAAASLLARVNKVAIEFRHGSITELPFKSAAYDVVVGIAILHHLSEAGVVEVLRECHRILRDGGIAVFVEPVENSKIFNFMQNLFPVRGGGYRPSILQRKAWARYKETRDDRAMSNLELIRAGEELFRSISISPYGCLVRLARFFGAESREILLRVDRLIFRVFPPLRHYCQTVLVEYRK
jgi:SAM-dependent methyltransferase